MRDFSRRKQKRVNLSTINTRQTCDYKEKRQDLRIQNKQKGNYERTLHRKPSTVIQQWNSNKYPVSLNKKEKLYSRFYLHTKTSQCRCNFLLPSLDWNCWILIFLSTAIIYKEKRRANSLSTHVNIIAYIGSSEFVSIRLINFTS